MLEREELDPSFFQRVPIGSVIQVLEEGAGAQDGKRHTGLFQIDLERYLGF